MLAIFLQVSLFLRQLHPLVRPLAHLLRNVLQTGPEPSSDGRPCLLDMAQELGMILKPVLEPVILAFETDQHAGGSSVAGDQNLPVGREL
jgi:hypothetical protein